MLYAQVHLTLPAWIHDAFDPGAAFASDEDKVALARAWLRCWRPVGFWLNSMPSTWYIVGVLATVFTINLALRAVPFAILKPLRESKVVKAMATWMPAGILAILAASTFNGSIGSEGAHFVHALIAVAFTTAVHLTLGRRTLLSVGAGTLTYVLLVTFL